MRIVKNKIRKAVAFSLFCLLAIAVNSNKLFAQTGKSLNKVSVLYVGYSPDRELPPNGLRTGAGISDIRYEEDMRSRMGEFEDLLKEYFGKVTTVDARDYKESLSAEYDVTVFDGTPEPIRPLIHEKDPVTGKTIRYEAPQYLSDGFSDAAVLIAQMAPTLGEPIRTKTDWYCMCLYNYAFEINQEHPIFNEPLKVKIKMKKVETPPELYNYPTGKDLPPKIPMWQVQTESSKDGNGYRTGIVSHGRPFMEAPDCEYISGGQCMKEITAATIARHGNFLLWGYAASPDYLTKEAKKTFVNSVYYMSKYKNRIPILRANNDSPRPRSYIDYMVYTYSKQKYEIDAENTRSFVKTRLEQQIVAREKVASGEDLSTIEKYALDFKPYEPSSWEHYIEEKKKSELVKSFNGSIEKAVAYLEAYRPYYTGESIITKESFDADAISLGIANNDHRIIDAAISLLEKGESIEKANRILERYTIKEFTEASEWRSWYNRVKDHLFFAESGGYKFYVDSYNNPEFYHEEIIGLENMIVPEPDDINPVTSSAKILPTTDGNRAVVIKVRIKEGFYVYSSALKDIPFTFFSADINLPEGMTPFGKLRMPREKPYTGDPDIAVYKGELHIIQKITGDSDKEFECKLAYQYCNDDYCGLPVYKDLKLNMNNKFELFIQYNQPADDSLSFSYRNMEGEEVRTMIPVKNGRAFFTAETCHPYWARFNSQKYPANGGVLMDYGKLIFSIDTFGYKKTLTGSSLQIEYDSIYRKFGTEDNNLSRYYINKYVDFRANPGELDNDALADSMAYNHALYERYKNKRDIDYIKEYPGSYYSLALAKNMFHSTVAYEEIKTVFDLLSPEIQQSVLGKELGEKVLAARLTGIGSIAPDIVLYDTEGKEVSLKDYRGKIVMLDFYKWGCPPCEELMEALKPVYEKYNSKGFEVLGIYHRTDNNLKSSRLRWAELLKKHQNPAWPNLFDLDNMACDTYGIEAFPSSLLIDKEGKIVSYEIGLNKVVEYLERELK